MSKPDLPPSLMLLEIRRDINRMLNDEPLADRILDQYRKGIFGAGLHLGISFWAADERVKNPAKG